MPPDPVATFPSPRAWARATSSGELFLLSGIGGSTGVTGAVRLSSGVAGAGDSGDVNIGSGASTGGQGGDITMTVGSGSSGVGRCHGGDGRLV